MGTVYRARQEVMGRDVAIKILRSDRAFDGMAKARFAREAHAMSLLSSPHTVTVFDFGEIPDPTPDEFGPRDASLYLAMELLEGESLGARLNRRGRLPVEEAARVTREALLSLAEAHEKGIIHRDLKPDNLFLARIGHDDGPPRADRGSAPPPPPAEIVKVLDFGIAKVRVEPSVDALETQAGTVFGTPRYMSPEQAQGKDLDARSDLYTLGVLLYQMLVGKPPFVDDDAVVVMARHIKSTAVPPADAAPDAPIGAALSALVMRTLSKDPGDRPPTAPAFMAELDRAMRARGADRRARPAVGASGEVSAMVHDGLYPSVDTSRSPARMPLGRATVMVGTSAAVVLSAGLYALGALRPARIPLARAEIGHVDAARRIGLRQVALVGAGGGELPQRVPVASAAPPPTAEPAPVEPPASAISPSATAAPARKPAGAPRYRRFEPWTPLRRRPGDHRLLGLLGLLRRAVAFFFPRPTRAAFTAGAAASTCTRLPSNAAANAWTTDAPAASSSAS